VAVAAELDIAVVDGGDAEMFSSLDPPTRNVNRLAPGLDLSGASYWNSRDGERNYRGGALISPRHVVANWQGHYTPTFEPGDKLRWLTADNVVVEGEIATGASVPRDTPQWPDIGVYLLVEPIFSVPFAKVLPPDWRDWFPAMPGVPEDAWRKYAMPTYVPEFTRLYRRPVLTVDQFRKLKVADIIGEAWLYPTMIHTFVPKNAARAAYWSPTVGGDCGHPTYLWLNGEAVLLNATMGGGSGTLVSDYYDEINTIMTALGGGYQLTAVDLSGFVKV
jgi:hypothetical protein